MAVEAGESHGWGKSLKHTHPNISKVKTYDGEWALAGKDLGRSCQADLPPLLPLWTLPFLQEDLHNGGGGPKIFKSIYKLYMPIPYVDNAHPLLIPIPLEISKLAKNLAARADGVEFFKLSQKYKGPHNLYQSHPERISWT